MAASRIENMDGPLVEAARSAEGVARVGVERAKAAVETSSDLIKESPLKSVLIAAGVGALVGFLIGRRR
jgi:ElaB/YqjD/DUF883 family membrane-anchored ribosome-binding protein